MKSPTLYLFVTSLVLLVISNQALGLTTVWIDPTTGNDATGQCNIQTSPFKTIDGSLQACHTTPGDITINLAPQNYPSAGNQQLPLTAGGVITVQAVGGTATIQLTTYFASAGLPTNLILANIVFLGGSSTNYGGVLSLTDGAYVIASNVVFNGAISSIGGGAVFISGSIGSAFTNCQFINCKTTGTNHYGGAVALFNATAAFTSTSFNQCSSQRGGAVYIENEESLQASSPTVTFSNCTFTNNVVDATNAGRDSVLGGGAVNVFAFTQSKSTDPPPVVFRNCTFTSNAATASQGGAVYLGDYTGASVIDTSFSQNSAFMGGAIYGSNAVILDISGSLFSNNNATHVDGDTSGKGGSIYLKTSSINVLSSEFSYNYAAESGGAVQIVGGKSHVESNGADYSNFTNCRFLYNTAFFTGGALQAEYLTGSVYIQSSNFVSNVVQGAGSFVNGQGTGGGAIFASAVYLEIGLDSSVTLFEKNYATMGMGGAIYSLIPEGLVISPSNPRVPAIYSAVFDQNIASTGGAICIDGVGSNLGGYAFIGTRFSNNEATGSNAALPGYGGAMMSFNTTFGLSSCSIFNNQAAAQGGGLWAGGEVPSFPTIINTTFANNAAPNNATLSSGAAFVGNTHAYFINTHMNAPEQTPTQVDLYVGERAIVQIAANPYSEHNVDPNTPCQFFGFLVTDNAYLVFNCTPTVSLVYLEKSGNVSINQATRMIISSQLNWLGGGFACNAEGGIVHYVNNNNDPKETAHLQNNDPKFLQKCNFASTGSLYFSHDPSGVAIDLELTEDAQIINYGTARTMGEPVLHSLSNSFFENQGHLIIERTFSLTGPSFGFSSPPPDSLLFISLFNPDSSFNISGSEIAPSSASDVTPYTAFSLTGNFAPNGLLQVNFPDLYKGLSWPSLITYQSHSSKFSVHRGAVPNNKGVLVGLRLKPQYASTSLSFSISSTATLLSGNQVFGIIFGVLLIVSLIGFGVYFWYRKKSGVVEYHGQVYETIDKPVYGSA